MRKLSPYLPRVRPDVDMELQRDLRLAYERVNTLAAEMEGELVKIRDLAKTIDFNLIRQALSAGSPTALNVQGLLGVLSQQQTAGLNITTVAPTANDDSSRGFAVGNFWFDTTADQCYGALDVTVGAAVWKLLG